MTLTELDAYLITEKTYVMQSKLVNNRYYTAIIDKDGTFDCPKSILRVIRTSCRVQSVPLERSKFHAKRFFPTGVHKLPIILSYDSEHKPVIFFSIYSPRSSGNVWLNFRAITNISPSELETTVTLLNGEELTLPVQYQAFCGLYVRAIFFYQYLTKQFPKSLPIT